jgi:regulator of protease activity HflC (stomatin/prohibitin superfamily)
VKASRFVSIFNEYDKAKEVTQERMYLETMEKVLADIEKVIIEKKCRIRSSSLFTTTRTWKKER